MPATRLGPWPCSFGKCLKSFSRINDLNRHQSVHTGIKPHICNVCQRGFSQKSGLKTHHNIHTKAKPYVCNIGTCKKAFGDPSSCTRHRRETHSSEGAFWCPICMARIKRKCAFRNHVKAHFMQQGIIPSKQELDDMALSQKNKSQKSNFHFMPPQVADTPYCPPSETSLPGVTENNPAQWAPAPRLTSNYQMSVPEYGGASGVTDGMYVYNWLSEHDTGRSVSLSIPAPSASTGPPTHTDDFIFDAGYNGHLQPNDMFSQLPSPYVSVSPPLPPLLNFTDCFGSRMRSMSSSPATCSNSALDNHLGYTLLDYNVPNPYLLFNTI